MKRLEQQPKLVEQVQRALLNEISTGAIPPGTRIIQETIAQQLGVSRQPVQQALLLLHKQGVLIDAPGRGLQLAPLDPRTIHNIYALRAVIEGLACRQAAERNPSRAQSEGPSLIAAGQRAARDGSVNAMIAADMAFHAFLYDLADNPLIAPALDVHWPMTQRIMGEVLRGDEQPRNIWRQHEAILEAIGDGDTERAETLARRHISEAAHYMTQGLQERVEPSYESL